MAHLLAHLVGRISEWWLRTKPTPPTLATATSPDELIADKIINDFSRVQLEGWERKAETPRNSTFTSMALTSPDGSIRMTWDENSYYDLIRSILINQVPIDDRHGRRIIDAYKELSMAKARAKSAQEAAIRKMKENEEKWNLAETLLGLKRNEHGALVPAEKTPPTPREIEVSAPPMPETPMMSDESPLLSPIGT